MTKAHSKLPRFAKRHYEAIALALQDARVHLRCDAINQQECVLSTLADLFATDNPQFERDRFISACTPGANVRARS
jgi:hypothetical protein